MKNPHGVEPTRYKKRKGSKYAIECDTHDGPRFGNGSNNDIFIDLHYYKENGCSIQNDGRRGYVCDSEYKSSLFVNTAGPDEENEFRVLDYEVYSNSNICSCCICF